jgi:hypothetical protein
MSEIMENAMEKIVMHYVRSEQIHFRQNLTEEETTDKELFVKKLKAHILYSLWVLSCNGDEDELAESVEELWGEEHNEFCDCDEEDEDMPPDTILTGIVCRECGEELPPHTISEHLSPTNKILECPHKVD